MFFAFAAISNEKFNIYFMKLTPLAASHTQGLGYFIRIFIIFRIFV